MNKCFSLYLIVILSLFVNCKQNKNPYDSGIDAKGDKDFPTIINLPETGSDTLKVSYFADTIIYVPLQTRKDNYIQILKQIWINDSIILVNSSDKLFLFLKNGKYIRQIGRKGKGPGEYARIFNFCVLRDTIYISSTGKRSLLRYKFDGTFCDEIQLNYQPVYFNITDDNKLACYNRAEGKIYLYNKGLFSPPDTVTAEYGVTIDRHKYSTYSPFMTYFHKSDESLLFTNYVNDTIWNISSEGKSPAYKINMHEKYLPHVKQIEFCKENFQRWEEIVKNYHFTHLVSFSSYSFIFQKQWMNPKNSAIYLENIKTGMINRYDTFYIYDDIVSNQEISYILYSNSTQYLIALEDAQTILKNIEQSKINLRKIHSQSFTNRMKNLTEMDNPVLIFIKIKK